MSGPGMPRGLIAVPLAATTMAEALAGLDAAAEHADAVELRLDLFREAVDLPALLRRRRLPAIVTLRPVEEGGLSRLPAGERLNVLRAAAELGAEYVDVEARAVGRREIATLRAAGARVIASRHDFSAMPHELAGAWWAEVAALEPDVVKVVGMARDPRDCLPALWALRRADRPTVAIAMGEAGIPSRILCLREERCFLTFAALAEGGGTAPGQVSLRDMVERYGRGQIGPRTAAFGVLSPAPAWDTVADLQARLGARGLDAVVVPFLARGDAAEVVDAYRALLMAGWQVPDDALQGSVLRALDELAPAARRRGRVNTIVRRGDALVGDWLATVEERVELWAEGALRADQRSAMRAEAL